MLHVSCQQLGCDGLCRLRGTIIRRRHAHLHSAIQSCTRCKQHTNRRCRFDIAVEDEMTMNVWRSDALSNMRACVARQTTGNLMVCILTSCSVFCRYMRVSDEPRCYFTTVMIVAGGEPAIGTALRSFYHHSMFVVPDDRYIESQRAVHRPRAD